MSEEKRSKLVAEAVHKLYSKLPNHGKPRESYGEFTVLASIVAVNMCADDESQSECRVLSMATGTKCCGAGLHTSSASNGTILHDSHAEVLAKRGFVRYLCKSLRGLESSTSDDRFRGRSLLESTGRARNGADVTGSQLAGKYQLKSQWRILLYISDSPCGDASIYERVLAPAVQGVGGVDLGGATSAATPTDAVTATTFTGAKRVRPLLQSTATRNSSDSGGEGGEVGGLGNEEEGEFAKNKRACTREVHTQELGLVRTKSGRSDIDDKHRSNSMSCSDKICRWAHLGLQGALLAPWFSSPITLSGIVIDPDPAALVDAQLRALQRAVLGRFAGLEKRGSCANESCAGSGSCFACTPLSAPHLDLHMGPRFIFGKCATESSYAAASTTTKLQPSGVSVNWVRDVVINDADVQAQKDEHRCCDYAEMPTLQQNTHTLHGKQVNSTSIPSKSNAQQKTKKEKVKRGNQKHKRLVWTQGGTAEIALAQAGVLLGASKKDVGRVEACSRLCQHDIALLLRDLIDLSRSARSVSASVSTDGLHTGKTVALVPAPKLKTYKQCKTICQDYQYRRENFLAMPPFHEWIVQSSSNPHYGQFLIGGSPGNDKPRSSSNTTGD